MRSSLSRSRCRQTALILLWFVAFVQIIGGIYDIALPSMPSWHLVFLGAESDTIDSRKVALDLAQMDAIGGGLLAIGVAIVILVAGPLQRNDVWAKFVILALVLIGNGLNAYGMFQVGSPYPVPLVLIALTLLALGIMPDRLDETRS